MYSDNDKRIYSLPTGGSYDPLDLKRKLVIATAGKLNSLITDFNDSESDYERALAEDQLIAAARPAFGFKAINESGGVTDQTVLDYLAHFLEWLSQPFVTTFNSQPISGPCLGCP